MVFSEPRPARARGVGTNRESMRNGVTLTMLLVAPSMLATTACTRTYDGSIVPTYALAASSSTADMSVGLVRADPLPPDRLYRFPPPPSPPPEAIAAASEPAPRRKAGLNLGGFVPRIETEPPRPVTCRNESRDGRIRFVCD
jgi:hypothetical protein